MCQIASPLSLQEAVKSATVCTVERCTCECASACHHWSCQTGFLHRPGQGQQRSRVEGEGRWGCATHHWETLCQVHRKLRLQLPRMWQHLLRQQRQQKENGERIRSKQRTRQKHSSCDSFESTGNKSGRADLWQDEGRWRQVFQETGGMWTCCGLYPLQAQAATFLSFYCICSSWRGWMDGWKNLIISAEFAPWYYFCNTWEIEIQSRSNKGSVVFISSSEQRLIDSCCHRDLEPA